MVTNPEHTNCSEEVSFGLFDEIAHGAILSQADVLAEGYFINES